MRIYGALEDWGAMGNTEASEETRATERGDAL